MLCIFPCRVVAAMHLEALACMPVNAATNLAVIALSMLLRTMIAYTV